MQRIRPEAVVRTAAKHSHKRPEAKPKTNPLDRRGGYTRRGGVIVGRRGGVIVGNSRLATQVSQGGRPS